MSDEEKDENLTDSEKQDSTNQPNEKESADSAIVEASGESSEEQAPAAAIEEEKSDVRKGKPKSEKKEETAEDLLGAKIEQGKIRKAKGSKNVTSGICHVIATFNNTKVTFSDLKGNVISWSSSGKCNFRGSRKSTAYAAQVVTQDAGRTALSHGMKEVVVKIKGPGMGRDSAVRSLQSLGFKVSSIIDVTPVPHNGCRPPKRRRV